MELAMEHKQQKKKIDAKLLAVGKELLRRCQTDEQREEITKLLDQVANLKK